MKSKHERMNVAIVYIGNSQDAGHHPKLRVLGVGNDESSAYQDADNHGSDCFNADPKKFKILPLRKRQKIEYDDRFDVSKPYGKK